MLSKRNWMQLSSGKKIFVKYEWKPEDNHTLFEKGDVVSSLICYFDSLQHRNQFL